MIRYHFIAFFIGFVLDQIIGDPYWFPHPVRFVGKLIEALEGRFLGAKDQTCTHSPASKRRAGKICVLIVTVLTTLTAAVVVVGGYLIHPVLGVALEAVLTCTLFAGKSLRVESMRVYDALERKTLEEARYAVSMIVGRDTSVLDEIGVTKAAVETVAENTSDGVIAPMLYTALGGPILGYFYKSINTMDSMIGYKNDRYLDFGRAAARLDDVVNFIPARLSALLMIAACSICGKDYHARYAWKIFKRDRFNHASPNSAQTESVMAGALGIRLAGNAVYFGKVVEKPTQGDALRPIEVKDIVRANRLMRVTTWGFCLICMAVMSLFLW